MACEKLGVTAKNCWMVGDGEFDVLAGINAGMKTIWLRHGRTRGFSAVPWLEVEDLRELNDLAVTMR